MDERTAFRRTIMWVTLSLVFNVLLWVYYYTTATIAIADEQALDFLSGYLIEKSLSLENLFAFFIIFKQLHIPLHLQQRVFSYGIWGAVFMRLLLIMVGIWLVVHFHWLLYLMGFFLFATGIKMLLIEKREKKLKDTFIMKITQRVLRVTPEIYGNRFFIWKKGLLYATPLLVALIFVETSDLIFAVDSIPAIFAITQDPFIVWTSNIFAILGLRAMYFLLSSLLLRFHLLKYGIALVLVYIGSKMMLEPWLALSVGVSLGIIAGILLLFTLLSFRE